MTVLAAAVGMWREFVRRESRIPRDIPVLMYHNVLPEAEEAESVWIVTKEEFARQMDQLEAAGYETILPDDIAEVAQGRKLLPEKPVVITFDDGYLGVMEHAEPILAEHGFKAICYVIVGRIGGEGDTRGRFDNGPLMSLLEVPAMAKRGVVSIGSHSWKHGKKSPQKRAGEIGPSRTALRQLTGVDTHSYSYPFGRCGYDFMLEALRENGYTTAMACKDEMFRYGPDANLYEIPRISVYGGRHELSVQADAAHGEVSVSNAGVGLPLRVTVRDAARGREWTSDAQFAGGGETTVFRFPPEALDGEREIEAWDKFGIFRYWPPDWP